MRDAVSGPHVSADARRPRPGHEGADAVDVWRRDPLPAPSTGPRASRLTPLLRHTFVVQHAIDASPNSRPTDTRIGEGMRSIRRQAWRWPAAGCGVCMAGCGSGASGLTTGATQPRGCACRRHHQRASRWHGPSRWPGRRRARSDAASISTRPSCRASYLAYEAQQGAAGDQLAKIQKQLRHDLQDDLAAHRRGPRLLHGQERGRHQGRPAAPSGRRLHAQPAQGRRSMPRAASSAAPLPPRPTSRSTARSSGRSRTPIRGPASDRRSSRCDRHRAGKSRRIRNAGIS